MISDPKYGWCNFKLGDFKGTPSYLTDVPIDVLDAFSHHFIFHRFSVISLPSTVGS